MTVTRKPLFNSPQYLRMQAVGVDISDRSIKYIELLEKHNGTSVGRFGEIDLTAGVVEDGRIVNQNKLVESLSKLKDKGISFVRAALPEEQVYFFTMHIGKGTHEEMYTAIEIALEEHVPIPASETIFDFEVANETDKDIEVVVTAASRAIVESYTETFEKAGLVLLSLEHEAEAVQKAVVPEGDKTAHMIVDFGRTRTGISIISGGSVRFTSTVSIGGEMLTETLVKNFKISTDEAEKMKREYGMRRNSPRQDLFSILLNNVAVLRDEINKHFTYWHTHGGENGINKNPIEQIILVGGDSNLAGLPDYLSASLKVGTIVPDVWVNIGLAHGVVPPITRNDSLGYATAIGLALHKFGT